MKNFKKLMALVIACVMIITSMSVFATEMNNQATDAQITVSGLTAGDIVQFYQILEWDGSDTADKTAVYGGWKFTSALAGKGTTLKDKDGNAFANDAAAIAAIIGDPAGNPEVKMQLTSTIAGLLADTTALETGALTGVYATNSDATTHKIPGTEATLTIDGTTNKIGLYMALIDPEDEETVYNPVFVSADYNTENDSNLWNVTSAATYSNNAAAKKSTVEVDKKALRSTKGYDTSEKTWQSTRIGEIVEYEVKTTIPGYGDVYQAPYFKITDKLSALELTGAPVITSPAGAVATIDGDEGDDTYTITFDTDYLKGIKVPTEVVINYSAVVTTEAPLNVNEELNEVWVEYSHDPTDETDYDVKKDDTIHYTYTIDANVLGGYESGIVHSGYEIVKVGVDASGNPITSEERWTSASETSLWEGPLAGATFKLYTASTCKPEEEYEDADGNKLTLTSLGDGRITITGLDAGEYWLLEDKAPNGYIKSTTPVHIQIVPHFTEKTITEYYKDGQWSYTDNGGKAATYKMDVLTSYDVIVNGNTNTYTFYNEGQKEIEVSEHEPTEAPSSIVNTKGVELPSTGGMGTTLFYVIGAVLVLGAGILLVSKRRMSAN